MATLVKKGAVKTAANTKKEKRASTPKLVCIITGQDRFTNQDYLESKVPVAGSIERFVKHYICADAMKMLRAGSTIQEVRSKMKLGSELPIPSENMLKTAMEINGKRARKPKTDAAAKKPSTKKGAPSTDDAPPADAPTTADEPPVDATSGN